MNGAGLHVLAWVATPGLHRELHATSLVVRRVAGHVATHLYGRSVTSGEGSRIAIGCGPPLSDDAAPGVRTGGSRGEVPRVKARDALPAATPGQFGEAAPRGTAGAFAVSTPSTAPDRLGSTSPRLIPAKFGDAAQSAPGGMNGQAIAVSTGEANGSGTHGTSPGATRADACVNTPVATGGATDLSSHGDKGATHGADTGGALRVSAGVPTRSTPRGGEARLDRCCNTCSGA